VTDTGYRLLNHTADFGLEIYGPDMAGLFARAALSLFDVLLENRPKRGGRARRIEIEGQDRADLMINWLRELLYRFNGEARVLCGVEILSIAETHLSARILLEPYSARRHRIRNEIKAVTYHQIEVGPADDGWRARVIFDI
jgi:SHS2 domain-containing protein